MWVQFPLPLTTKDMVELVDMLSLGLSGWKTVWVQIPLSLYKFEYFKSGGGVTVNLLGS